jgi:septal ring factor EnvC (AmiA/AmiB activator)
MAQALSEIERATAEQARVRAELENLVAGSDAANRRLRDRVRALYRMSRAGMLPAAGGFHAMLSHLARMERLERIVESELRACGDFRRRADALRSEAARLAERIGAARAQVERSQSQKTALEEQIRRRALSETSFSSSPLRAAGTYDPATGYGIRVHDPRPAPTMPFESQRGQLALPLTAPQAVREASREDGSGVEFYGTRGAPVRASAAGRVAFAGPHPSYGRLVILDHRNGWFTVYGGLGRIDVEVGDQVSRGMHLGSVDREPIFFQVRRGTRAQNARSWLGI